MKNAVNDLRERKDEKLFNFRPALFAAFFLVLGIVFSYYRLTRGASHLWLLPLLIVLLALVFSESVANFLVRLSTVVLLLSCFFVGGTIFRSQIRSYEDMPIYTGEHIVVGEVKSKKDGGSTRLILTEIFIGEDRVEGRMIVYLPVYRCEQIRVGDRVLVKGTVKTDTSFFGKYGFKTEAIRDRKAYTLTTDGECVKVGRATNIFLLVRSRLEEVVYESMDETAASLTVALLTGDVDGADEELMDNMRYGGIAHIFAVSGLNVGALFAACLFLFSKTKLKYAPTWLRLCAVVGILFFYSGVCGFSASVVRAAIACAVFYLYKLLLAGNDLLNTLGVAAMLILLLSPVELFGVGFQLSFLACFGLFLLTKPTTHVFDELKNAYLKRFPRKYTAEEQKLLDAGDNPPISIGGQIWRAVTGVLSASIAAQIMTLPALLIHFDFLSGWSLLLNFVFVPMIDGIFTVLLALVCVSCILPSLGGILLYPFSAIWSALVLGFETLDFSTFGISGVQVSSAVCVCYYGGILFLTDKLNISSRMKKWLCVLFFAAFAVGLHILNL